MPDPTVGLALIAKDEADTLPRLLSSIEGAFDQLVLVDTGSTDRTRTVFREWADAEKTRNPGFRHLTAEFAWCDDFAAARAFADSLVETDWVSWADCDDEITNAHNIRALAANTPEHVMALIAGYRYAIDPHGNTICYLKRERLVRRGHGEWAGRVHEAQMLQGQVAHIDPSECEWVHHKPPGEASSERNVRILSKWLEDEPDNPRVLAYLGTEMLAAGKTDEAEEHFRRYISLKTGWDEERAQVYRKLAQARMVAADFEEAIALAFEALRLIPRWPDSHLTLAEAHYHLGEWERAAHWAREVLRIGTPDTMLIVNPTDYQLSPRVILAGALGQLGQTDEAIRVAEDAFGIAPHEGLAHGYRAWISARKRDSTAEAVVSLAHVLTAHDEQLNALQVLNAAPHFCRDHPRVVAERSLLRERVDHLFDPDGYARHYTDGGSKPEDGVDDPLAVGDILPRCAFLLRGVQELAAIGAAS